MNQSPRDFQAASRQALGDARLKQALGRLGTHFVQRRVDAIERYGDWESLREQGRAIRDYALSHLDTLLETFERNVIARGGQVHWARDAGEGRGIILEILRQAGARTVTKGKSMVSEEIGLNPHLVKNGIVLIDTYNHYRRDDHVEPVKAMLITASQPRRADSIEKLLLPAG